MNHNVLVCCGTNQATGEVLGYLKEFGFELSMLDIDARISDVVSRLSIADALFVIVHPDDSVEASDGSKKSAAWRYCEAVSFLAAQDRIPTIILVDSGFRDCSTSDWRGYGVVHQVFDGDYRFLARDLEEAITRASRIASGRAIPDKIVRKLPA